MSISNRVAIALTTAALCAAFALAPAPAFAQAAVQPVDRVIAVVNNEIVTMRELDAEVARTRARLQNEQPARVIPEDVLRKQLLEQLILDRAQAQQAAAQGIRIDDAQVDQAIETVAANNRLSVPQLRDKLAADGIDFATFRKDIRGQIVRARLREAEVDSRIQISEADVDAFLETNEQAQRGAVEQNIAQVFMKLPEEPDAQTLAEVTARMEQVRARAQAGEDFAALARSFSQAPEAVQGGSLGWRTVERLPGLFVEGLRGLEPGGLSQIIRSAAGLHLLKLVEQRGGAADVAGGQPLTQTRVRHILLRVDSERGEAEAERTLQSVRERLQEKQVSFEAMARQYSADGSASRGGELGWLYPGDTVPEFERAMNALAPGQVSEPVRSPFGLHLIQVVERRQSGNANDRKRQLARQKLREKRSDEAYREWLVQLRDRTYVEYRLEE